MCWNGANNGSGLPAGEALDIAKKEELVFQDGPPTCPELIFERSLHGAYR